MVSAIDYPAWIMLAFGIYALAAGIGEWRRPGFWLSMLDDVAQSPALRFLTGVFCIAVGTALYLTAPWDMGDWMQVAIKIIGAGMVIEGALFLAIGDLFLDFAKRLMGMVNRFWAGFTILLGIAVIVAAEVRI